MTDSQLQEYIEGNKKYIIGSITVQYVLQAYDESSKKFVYTGFTKDVFDIAYFYQLAKNINKAAQINKQQQYKRFRVKKQTIINEEATTFNMV